MEAMRRDKPKLVIGSPPCTMFFGLWELNSCMYKDGRVWMLRSEELLNQAKCYATVCADVYE